MTFSGTLVTADQGLGVVTATGSETELGRISALVARVEQLTTPLLRQIASFGRWLTSAIIVVAMLAFVFGILVQGYSAADMFLAAVGLAVAAMKAGVDGVSERQCFPRTDVIPFDSAHKFMATLHHSHDGRSFAYIKGAPEQLLQRCSSEHHAGETRTLRIAHWEHRIDLLGADGFRVIALARKPLPRHSTELNFGDIEHGLEFVGLCGLIDPPRPTAADAVATAQHAGIRIKMITAATLALALAFEPPETGIMRRPPRNPREPVLSRLFVWRIAFVSMILVVGTFALFLLDRSSGASIEHSRTIAVNTLVAFEIFYLFNARFIEGPVLNRDGLFGNRFALVAIAVLAAFRLAFTYLPPLQRLFGTTPLGIESWLTIILVGSSVLWLVEIEKALLRRGNH